MKRLNGIVLLAGLLAGGALAAESDPDRAADLTRPPWREEWRKDPLGLLASAPLAVWKDQTVYSRVYHVAQRHPDADDAGPGTAERPLRTIGRAAELLQPGEKVIVHAGRYRECVRPARGGTGPAAMIAYGAAPGEEAVITALEPLNAPPLKIDRSKAAQDLPDVPLWRVELPTAQFGKFNPFTMSSGGAIDPRFPDDKKLADRIRGRIYIEGKPLTLVSSQQELSAAGTFFMLEKGAVALVRPPAGTEPKQGTVEVSARAQCFTPSIRGAPYIRVSGLVMEDAANNIPMPQHGALSANGGHHWIIEGNTILRANTVGIDIGGRDSRPKDPLQLADRGGHIVRGNRIIGSGSGGIVGCANVEQSLIIGNLIEDTGRLGAEACWEAAAMKFHYARRMVIRDNVIRRVHRAPGIWIDYACRDNRISGNTIVDVLTVLAGIYVEASLGPNLIDGNIIWAIKDRLDNEPPKDGIEGGMGISVDVSDNCVIAHNLVALVGKEGKNTTMGTHGIACHLAQGRRLSRDANNEHSAAACGGMAIAHNIVCNCFARVRLDRVNKNQCYGNIYPELIEGLHPRQLNEQAVRFVIKEHDRSAMYGLLAWQQFFDYDTEAVLAKNASITRPTPDTLQLAGRELAAPLPGKPGLYAGAGPFNAEQLRVLAEGGTLTLGLTVPPASK